MIALKAMSPGNAFIRKVVKEEKGDSFSLSCEGTAFNSYKEE